MRVYISGPITGQEDTAKDRFFKAQCDIWDAYGVTTEIINPHGIGERAAEYAELTHEEFMKISFTLMDICNAVYFLDGWQDSKGCQQEHIYALNTGMEVLNE